ncbi:MAG TPA: NAD-dependent epimerase/dehydratase family protein [Casimicrobiaceae bacterium]|nr:NAD-dependent epimerase/dehydratase family protein [Casimicrobiaceae bacterium]
MRILVLGGTVFLGRHIVAAALARGHDVTLFNRGRQNPHLFPEVEKLRGDRDGVLSALNGRSFDGVIDPSGSRPEHIRAAVTALGGTNTHYTFISSISVYREFPPGRLFDENATLAEGDESFGALKARSEEALEAALPGRVARVRPGLIVGPHDPTDRFTYWPRRIACGGEVLAPGRPDRPVQFVDVRDLAEWCVRIAEEHRVGAFNAVGPASTLTMAQLLDECRVVAGRAARFTWVRDEDLIAAGIKAWTELPLWIPEGDAHFGGMLLADNRRAVAAALTFRQPADTICTTLEWDLRDEGSRAEHPLRITPLAAEREAQLLALRASPMAKPQGPP